MTFSTGLWVLSTPWVLAVLLALGVGGLEGERYWTRTRRRAAARPGPLAYCLDGLSLGGIALFILGLVLLILQLVGALVRLAGTAIGWMGQQASAHPWPLVGGAVLCLAVVAAVVLGRNAMRARALRPVAAPTPRFAVAHAVEMPAASAVGGTTAPRETAGELSGEELGGLSMYQARSRPSSSPAMHPQSFLDMRRADAPPENKPKRRSAVVPALVGLIVIALVAGGVLFRTQIVGLVSGVAGVADERAPAATQVAGVAAAGQTAPSAAVGPTAAPVVALEVRRVKSDSLNLRVAPGTDQAVLGVLARGEQVTLLSERQDIAATSWVKVRAGEREGWVSEKLLEP
jgi:hypothetical protein